MTVPSIIAVITGDLVKSRDLESRRLIAIDLLGGIASDSRRYLQKKKCRLYYSKFYRGDSFQFVISDPKRVLWLALFIRSALLKNHDRERNIDARLGVGFGTSTLWIEKNLAASDGEAFRLSGKALESIKLSKEKYRRMRMSSPWENLNGALSMIMSSLDAIVQRWTLEQAEAISLFLLEKTQDAIAQILKIRQPAVQTRLQTAGHFAIKESIDFFESLIGDRNIDPEANNPSI